MDFGKAPEPGTVALILVTATVTALISTLMGTLGKAAAEWLLNLILRPARFVRESLYIQKDCTAFNPPSFDGDVVATRTHGVS